MTRINTRVALPILTTLIGLLWIYVGLTYHGWYSDGRAASGFFPSIVGGLLAFVSVLAVVSESKVDPPEFWKSHVHPLIAAVAVVILALLIGFFPALTLYVFGWIKWYEKYSWRLTILITVITIAAMYGIFAMWLRVPFPEGAVVEMLRR